MKGVMCHDTGAILRKEQYRREKGFSLFALTSYRPARRIKTKLKSVAQQAACDFIAIVTIIKSHPKLARALGSLLSDS